jgi:predicted RNA-binding Zn-ribbon protein involved in translation (DUF1610 family)
MSSSNRLTRRCPSCGSDLRTNVRFCPRCGNKILPASDSKEVGHKDKIENRSVTKLSTNPTVEVKPKVPIVPKVEVPSASSSDGRKEVVEKRVATDKELDEKGLRPKVEKIRQVSNVVLDEAAIDPSLRFLLIASLIFIVFIVLLLLHKLI